MPKTPEQNIEKERLNRESVQVQKFKEALRNWRTSPDGEDFCPNCWGKHLSKFSQEHQKIIKDDSRPTADCAKYRKSSEGWYVLCRGESEFSCKQEVFVPFE